MYLAVTNPDEHGGVLLLEMLNLNGAPQPVQVFHLHTDDLSPLVQMLVEGLTDEQRDDLRGLL